MRYNIGCLDPFAQFDSRVAQNRRVAPGAGRSVALRLVRPHATALVSLKKMKVSKSKASSPISSAVRP